MEANKTVAPTEWKVVRHPFCAGRFAISRMVGENREYQYTGSGVSHQIEMFYTRGEAEAAMPKTTQRNAALTRAGAA